MQDSLAYKDSIKGLWLNMAYNQIITEAATASGSYSFKKDMKNFINSVDIDKALENIKGHVKYISMLPQG